MVSSGSENHIVDPPNVNIPMDLCAGPQDGVFEACKTASTLPDDPRRAIYLSKESHCITPVHAPSTWRPFECAINTLIRVLLACYSEALDTGGHIVQICSVPRVHCVAVVSGTPSLIIVATKAVNISFLVDVKAVVAHHVTVGGTTATNPGGERLVFLFCRYVASVELSATSPPFACALNTLRVFMAWTTDAVETRGHFAADTAPGEAKKGQGELKILHVCWWQLML